MDTPRAQASHRIKAVEQALSDARAKWTGLSVSIGSYFGNPQDQVLGAIASMERLGVTPWKARADKLLPTDQKGWNRWVQDGNDLLSNLATTAQDSESSTLGAIIAEPIKASVADVAHVAKTVATKTADAAQAVWDARKWIVAGLVALAALLLGGWLYLRFGR